MDEDGDAGGQQFWPRGGDGQDTAILEPEGQRCKLCWQGFVINLGLRDGGLAFGTPERRRHLGVGQPVLVELNEGPLRDALRLRGDGRVAISPIDAQAKSPPDGLETVLSLLDQLQAACDELLAVHLGRFAANGLFDEALGGQAIVVEAHRIEDTLAAHPVVTRDYIGLGVGIAVADVKRAGDGQRWRVDGVDGAGRVCIICIQVAVGPETSQARLGLREEVTVGQHVGSTPFCTKNAACSQGRGQRICSWYHLVLIHDTPNQQVSGILKTALTGYTRNILLRRIAARLSDVRLPSHVQGSLPEKARTRWPSFSGGSVPSTPLVRGLLYVLYERTIHGKARHVNWNKLKGSTNYQVQILSRVRRTLQLRRLGGCTTYRMNNCLEPGCLMLYKQWFFI